MTWKDAIKKEEEKPKGTWPMGTLSQQKSRDADERGELSPSGDEKKKKELLDYIKEIESKTTYVKEALEQSDTENLHRVLRVGGTHFQRQFNHIKEISEDVIEILDDKEWYE